jgi:hypothetical protein
VSLVEHPKRALLAVQEPANEHTVGQLERQQR